MYKEVFKFNARPFTAAPYVKHYFANESMNQTLTQARNCIDRSAGPVVVVGGAGSGKSLLLGMLEDQYQSQFSVANLTCVRLDQREDLLKSILFSLDQPHQGMSEGDLRFALINYLKPSDRCPNGVLLLIDDAQTLGPGLLDEIRLITNFVRDGQARVRLVLAGTQTLEENLTSPKLQSLNQRIAARCYLTSMRREETARYVTEHINRVGGNGAELFDPQSLKTIHEVSDGCPRLVNQVCEHALIVASTRGASQITEDHVREAWADVQGIPGDWSAPETAAKDTSALQQDDGWTVIEFGQLDDADETEQSGTVYDFENSEGQDSGVDQDNQTPAAQTVEDETTTEAKAPEADSAESNPDLNEAPAVAERIVVPVINKRPQPVAAEENAVASPQQSNETTDPQPEPAEPTVEEIAAANGVQLRKTVETVDPFDESFAEEETLLDRFAPVVAHQNQSSLDVTSNDLEAIRPAHDNPVESPTGNRPPVELQSPARSTVEQSSPTPVTPKFQLVQSKPEKSARTQTAETPEPEREPDRDSVVDNAEEIEREAEQILERLRMSTVSHETETETESATNSPQSLAVENQSRDLDESQKVLQEILSQKTMLASATGEANQPGEAEPQSQTAPEPESINIEYPVASASPTSQPRRDDSEMLIVSRMEQQLESPAPKEPEPIPFPETPVSKGRAQRMDYQQLFDQLRDISKDQV